MSRQPRQVHIFLYRYNTDNEYEYSIFQRADNEKWWQGVCGGVEQGETLEEAARREVFEESGISEKLPLYRLETESYLPVHIFNKEIQRIWGNDLVVVPMYFFAMPYDGKIKLSHEHKNVLWLKYDEAEKCIYFHDQKTALYELNERLSRGILLEDI